MGNYKTDHKGLWRNAAFEITFTQAYEPIL